MRLPSLQRLLCPLVGILLVSCPVVRGLEATSGARGATLRGSLEFAEWEAPAPSWDLRVLVSGKGTPAIPRPSVELASNPITGSPVRLGSSLPSGMPAPSRREFRTRTQEEHPYVAPRLWAAQEILFVRQKPLPHSPKLGYLRAGMAIGRGESPVGYEGCDGGWYRVAPMGFVCAGPQAVVDPEHPIVGAFQRGADRDAPMPYLYAKSRSPAPLLYVRVPSRTERRKFESSALGVKNLPSDWAEYPMMQAPDLLARGAALPALHGYLYAANTLYLERAKSRSTFALQSLFQTEQGAFGLSVELNVLPLDRLEPVAASEFSGVIVGPEQSLPVAFSMSRKATLYSGEPSVALRPVRLVTFREAFALSGRSESVGGRQFLQTSEGMWLHDSQLVRVSPSRGLPFGVKANDSWIDISLRDQTLVAYEGLRPVFVTLVSTGIADTNRTEASLATPEGVFRIHAKHVSTTMAGDEIEDSYSMGDVPWVQYFNEGYALHAAYWHDGFGRPKSHGCVNLSPADALWLFKWSDPPVPRAWHGAMSTRGSVVRIRQ